jgi:hypothetical protein
MFADGGLDAGRLALVHYNAEFPTCGLDLSPSFWRKHTKEGDSGKLPASVQRLLEMGIISDENLHRDTEPADPEGWERVQTAACLAEYCSAKEIGLKLLFHKFTTGAMQQLGWPIPDLLRCIFGNPFRVVSFDPRWRTEDVLGVARGIYEERAFDRLPLLADALMDAGCDDEQVLGHCRDEGPHARGCWVVDLVLGKE